MTRAQMFVVRAEWEHGNKKAAMELPVGFDRESANNVAWALSHFADAKAEVVSAKDNTTVLVYLPGSTLDS